MNTWVWFGTNWLIAYKKHLAYLAVVQVVLLFNSVQLNFLPALSTTLTSGPDQPCLTENTAMPGF